MYPTKKSKFTIQKNKIMNKRITLLAIMLATLVYGQNDEQKRWIQNELQKSVDYESVQSVNEYIINQERKVNELVENGLADRFITNEKGNQGELVRITDDGELLYYFTDNVDAAASTRTNFLHDGGGLNLNLRGTDLKVGVWDKQMALQSHFEFADDEGNSRILLQDGPAGQNEFHATHVTGTIAARGVNSNAKGMATDVKILSHNWNSDLLQVQQQANSEGLLVSNHSYGTPVENINDANVGKYISESRLWDTATRNFIYTLPFISAGNDGGTGNSQPIGPGLDKLVGNKVSKNVMVIANANDAILFPGGGGELANVSINPGSSQGPTDDGRIKPDVAGNGTGVLSSSNQNNAAYGSSSGTSMSAPNVAGTAILLQELYFDINEEFMISSTLRGLLCHTADDFGDFGPDPESGWGLVNAKVAAETILDSEEGELSIIEEYELSNNETYSFEVFVEGGKDLRASITWIDREGDVNNGGANDDTPVLVNDLDLRVISESGEEFEPWMLNRNNLNLAAIKGDNIVDNIEIVDVNQATSGFYTIEITHKGDLFAEANQRVSIIVTGINQTMSNEDFVFEDIKVWPNPVKEKLNISLNQKLLGESVQLEVYDITGRKVINTKKVPNSSNLTLDTSALNSGTYILKIISNNQVYSQKLMRQ